jgi:hypothetical protein
MQSKWTTENAAGFTARMATLERHSYFNVFHILCKKYSLDRLAPTKVTLQPGVQGRDMDSQFFSG